MRVMGTINNIRHTGLLQSIGYALCLLYFILTYVCYIDMEYSKLITYDLYALCGLALVYTFLQKDVFFTTYHKLYFSFIVVIFFFAVVPYVGTSYAGKVLSSLFEVLTLFLLTYCISIFLRKDDLPRVFQVISVSSILLFFFTVRTFDVASGDRFGNELAGNANIISPLYMLAAISSVYCIFTQRNIFVKLLFCIFYCLQVYAIILTGTKKALLVSVLFLGLYFMFTRKRKVYVFFTLLLFCCFAYLGYWALFNISFIYDLIGYRFEGMIMSLTTNQGDASTMERINMMHDAVDFWTQRPLFGMGLNLFSERSIYGTYSHNNYVELLATTGLVGFVSYYIIYVGLLWRLYGSLSAFKEQGMFYVLLIFCLLFFDIGAVTYNYPLIQVFLSLCGIYCYRLNA